MIDSQNLDSVCNPTKNKIQIVFLLNDLKLFRGFAELKYKTILIFFYVFYPNQQHPWYWSPAQFQESYSQYAIGYAVTTVGSKIIRVVEIILIKKLIPNAVL